MEFHDSPKNIAGQVKTWPLYHRSFGATGVIDLKNTLKAAFRMRRNTPGQLCTNADAGTIFPALVNVLMGHINLESTTSIGKQVPLFSSCF
jgi:hypothetical protein